MRPGEFEYYLVVGAGRVARAIARFEATQRMVADSLSTLKILYGARGVAHDEFGLVLGVTFEHEPDPNLWEKTQVNGGGEPFYKARMEEVTMVVPKQIPTAFGFAKDAGLEHLVITNEMGKFIRQAGYRRYFDRIVVFRPVEGEVKANVADFTGLMQISQEEFERVSGHEGRRKETDQGAG